MARFIAGIERENKEDVTRLGHSKGITAYVNGWDTGVVVYSEVDELGHDRFKIYQTGGSNSYYKRYKLIATIENNETKLERALTE